MNRYVNRLLAEEILFAEALALDEQRWNDWLAMLHPQVKYWVPAWNQGVRCTADPASELSLIYYADRRGLEDRVKRISSGRSAASMPLKRTSHIVANVTVIDADEQTLKVHSAFHVDTYDSRSKEIHPLFGRQTHVLSRQDTGNTWLITERTTVLLNDYIPGAIDFYCL